MLCSYCIHAATGEANDVGADANVPKIAKVNRFPNLGALKKRFNAGAASSFALGGAVLSGGVMGYVTKKSVPSLVGSAILGGALLGGSGLIVKDEDLAGHTLSTVASGGITAIGAWRYFASKKAMPGIPLMLLGAVSTIYHGKEMMNNYDKPFPEDLGDV